VEWILWVLLVVFVVLVLVGGLLAIQARRRRGRVVAMRDNEPPTDRRR
jgi:hypothetical protein